MFGLFDLFFFFPRTFEFYIGNVVIQSFAKKFFEKRMRGQEALQKWCLNGAYCLHRGKPRGYVPLQDRVI